MFCDHWPFSLCGGGFERVLPARDSQGCGRLPSSGTGRDVRNLFTHTWEAHYE
jgi:hypothetical protein